MTSEAQQSIPSTFEMIQRTKRPKVVSRLERVDNYSLGALLGLGLLVLGTYWLGTLKWISLVSAERVLVCAVVAMVGVVVSWGAAQIIGVAAAWKAGYRPAAERIDAGIALETQILDELARCNPRELRERSQHLELEAKVLSRRAGLFTVTSAIAVVLINLFDKAERAKLWPELPIARVFVYTGSLGILSGSLLLVILVGKLERISGLFELAARRYTDK